MNKELNILPLYEVQEAKVLIPEPKINNQKPQKHLFDGIYFKDILKAISGLILAAITIVVLIITFG